MSRASGGVRKGLVLAGAVVGVVTVLAAPAGATPVDRSIAVPGMADRVGLTPVEAAGRVEDQLRWAGVADRLSGELGDRYAGSYLDDGVLTVAVLDDTAGDRVRAAGARPVLVEHGTAELTRIQADLVGAAGTARGFSVSVDPRINSVVLSVPDGRLSPALRKLVDTARGYGTAVRVERIAAAPAENDLVGGTEVRADAGWICTAGFMARRGDEYYVITAGHCTEGEPHWSSGGKDLGPTGESDFPGTDYGSIRISDPDQWDPKGAVRGQNGTQEITGTTKVPVGGAVCKTGRTTDTTCGEVLRYDVSITYSDGTRVKGLTETNVCTRAGDSGGPLYAGSDAQGMVSGGTVASCSTPGFRSYFQPIGPALSGLNLSLL